MLVWALTRMITLSKFFFFLLHSVSSLNDWILSWKSRLKTTSVPPGPLISWLVLLALGDFSSHKLLAVLSPCLAELCHPPQWFFFFFFFLLGLWSLSFSVQLAPLILSCRMWCFGPSPLGHRSGLWEVGFHLSYRWTGSESPFFFFLFFHQPVSWGSLISRIVIFFWEFFAIWNPEGMQTGVGSNFLTFKQGDQLGWRWPPAERKKKILARSHRL